MALLYTPETEIGTPLPSFELPTVSGQSLSSESLLEAPVKLVVFICAHCPYVIAIEERLIQLGQFLAEKNWPMVAICSNDPTEYPEDSPQALLKRSKDMGYSFPYLVDQSQQVAKLFGAVCTPDFFVYDKENQLSYRGRLDDSWKAPEKVEREELKAAMIKIAQNEKLTEQSTPSMGCSIKWKND